MIDWLNADSARWVAMLFVAVAIGAAIMGYVYAAGAFLAVAAMIVFLRKPNASGSA